eukprot:jgi/Botrbrau1/1483/Bobra.178_3s0039.1
MYVNTISLEENNTEKCYCQHDERFVHAHAIEDWKGKNHRRYLPVKKANSWSKPEEET